MAKEHDLVFGVCTASMSQRRYDPILKALRTEAQHHHVKLLIFSCFQELSDQSPNDDGEMSIFQMLPYENLDALILLSETFKAPALPEDIAARAASYEIPVFSIDREVPGCINISYGYADAFAEMVEHLITVHGCKTLNLIAGIKGNSFEIERTTQYRNVLSRHGIPIEEERIAYGEFWGVPTYHAIDGFMRSNLPFPDAIVCENDSMAIAVVDRLMEYGYSVPEDVLVTGLDGIEEAANRTPSITTAHQDVVGSVKKIFELFWELHLGHEVETTHMIPFRATYEQSCGCVPVVANDASKIMTKLTDNWATLATFDDTMDVMRNEIIGLSYREMIQQLPNHMLDNSWICLRSDFSTSLSDKTAQFPRGIYGPEEAFTESMNCVLWKNFDVVLYNRFFNRNQLLPDFADAMENNSGLVFVPLHFQDAIFGYMAVSLDSGGYNFDFMRRFTTNICTILQVIQQQERVNLLNRQLESSNQKLTELYSIDPLTGLYNRRGFHEFMEKQMLEREDDSNLVLFSIDMDGLKTINDTFGHKEGDFALCLLSDCMKHLTRRYESLTAARFGGDEFILAGFFGVRNNMASEIERQFQNQLSFLNTGSGKDYVVAASVGHVEIHMETEQDLESAINEADTLMYIQKRERRENAAKSGGSESN